MEKSFAAQHPVWVDKFVSLTPPDYISSHPEGPRREKMLEEWQTSRRDKAIESLKEFLTLFPNAAPIDDIVRELESSSASDNIGLALRLGPSILSAHDLCLASELADAVMDPISRSSILTKMCQDHLVRNNTVDQSLRDTQGQLSVARSGLFASLAILFFLIMLSFSGHGYELAADSPHPEVLQKSWWGLYKQRFPIRWMAFDPYDKTHKVWCVQGNQGEWYPYFVDDIF